MTNRVLSDWRYPMSVSFSWQAGAGLLCNTCEPISARGALGLVTPNSFACAVPIASPRNDESAAARPAPTHRIADSINERSRAAGVPGMARTPNGARHGGSNGMPALECIRSWRTEGLLDCLNRASTRPWSVPASGRVEPPRGSDSSPETRHSRALLHRTFERVGKDSSWPGLSVRGSTGKLPFGTSGRLRRRAASDGTRTTGKRILQVPQFDDGRPSWEPQAMPFPASRGTRARSSGRRHSSWSTTIEPGGALGPIHNHKARPATVYVRQGTITGQCNGVAADYGPGVGWA